MGNSSLRKFSHSPSHSLHDGASRKPLHPTANMERNKQRKKTQTEVKQKNECEHKQKGNKNSCFASDFFANRRSKRINLLYYAYDGKRQRKWRKQSCLQSWHGMERNNG